MIFSNDSVARYLNESFECAWQELRPVPQVWIDFGNGKKLRRTLNGNIATWFCNAKGEVLDVVPGLVGADEYLRRARAAYALWQGFSTLKDGRRLVVSYHAALAQLPRVESAAVEQQIKRTSTLFDISKAGVEKGLKQALARSLRAHAPSARGGLAAAVSSAKLREDTRFNKARRYPKAHAMLAKAGLASPDQLTNRLFDELLGVDLADPYLGLAPYVLGGEGGRYSH